MKPNNAHEHVLVVGQYRHRFDIIDMSMLAKKSCKDSVVTSIYWYILRINMYILGIYIPQVPDKLCYRNYPTG